MKPILCLMSALVLCSFSGIAQVLINENFSTASQTTPPAGWTQNLIVGDTLFDQWHFDNPGNRTLNPIFSNPAAIFDSDFISFTGGPENVALESPMFDATSLNNVFLVFDHYFLELAGSAYFVEAFNGTNWDTVLTGTNTTSNPKSEIIDISSFVSGVSNAQIRFRWEGDYSWYWVVDNVVVYGAIATDLGVVSIDSPIDGCNLSVAEQISVTIENFGLSPQTNFPLSFSVDGGSIITETYTGPAIAPGATESFTFTGTGDLSSVGLHSVIAYTSLANDSIFVNDTLSQTIEKPQLNGIPLFDDFDSYANGATSMGIYSNHSQATFNFQVNFGPTGSSSTGPIGDAPDHGAGGFIYIESSGSTPGDSAHLVSECIDLTMTPAPNLIFSRHLYGGDIDSFKVNIDDGNTFNLLTVIGSELNADFEDWIVDTLDLTAFSGSSVTLHFIGYISDFHGDISLDNILIKEIAGQDAAIAEVILPPSACGLSSSEDVSIKIKNEGTSPIFGGMTTSFSVDGGAFSSPETISDTIGVGAEIIYTFTNKADLSIAGNHLVQTQVSLTGDPIAANDTLQDSTVTIPIISSYPFFENFENGKSGWEAEGMNSSWAFGTPAKDIIIGSASGLNAWTTGGLGIGEYNSLENSSVISPCFDMTTAPSNAKVSMNIWWNSEFSWDGAVLQTSDDGGNSWNNIGSFGDPNNWFTDNAINAAPGGQSEGWTGRESTFDGSGGWVNAQHDLDATIIGKANIIFRIAFSSDASINDDGFAFDDFGVGAPPVIDFGSDSLIACIGDSLTAGTDPTWSYLWSTGETTASILLQNTSGLDTIQKVWVQITDPLSLVSSDTIIVTIRANAPAVSVIVDNHVLCNGDGNGQATASGTSGMGNLIYSWATNPPQNTPTVSGLSGGTYQITVFDENNCSATSSVTIDEPDSLLLVIDSSFDVLCEGDSNGIIEVSVMGGTTPYSVSWNNGDLIEDLGGVPVGNYFATITDGNNCITVSPTIIIGTEDSLPNSIFDFMPSGAAINFMNNSINANTYQWDFGDNTTSNVLNPTHIYMTNDTFIVTLTVTNDCGSSTSMDTIYMTKVGVEENLLSSLISIFPNPNSGIFEIQFGEIHLGEIEISLSTIDGRLVYKEEKIDIIGPFNHHIKLDENLVKGIYVLRISTRDGVVHKRLRLE